MSDVCIRRWCSTWPACRCAACVRYKRRQRKLLAAGLVQRPSNDAAWAVIDWMLARNWTATAISSACRLPKRIVHGFVREAAAGHRRRFTAGIASRIINHGEPTRGYVTAIGARRKVRALAVMGHDQKTIADAAGVGSTTIAAIQRGSSEQVSPRIAAAVDRAWHALTRHPGNSPGARERALAADWYGVAAYDDIDDPADKPRRTPSPEASREAA